MQDMRSNKKQFSSDLVLKCTMMLQTAHDLFISSNYHYDAEPFFFYSAVGLLVDPDEVKK